MNKRKICVVTGTRAEYGLLYWLMKEIEADDALELQIIVTGAHLSQEFGLTYRTIEQDGFHIDEKVEMLLSSDTAVGITKSMGVELIGFADALERLKPDIMVLLGDRYEILVAAEAAMMAMIPIAHIHGGETTEGLVDEAIRHCITKMSLLHFTSTEAYRKRVIQLGEDPSRVFNVGAIGLDNVRRLQLLSRDGFEKSIGFHLQKVNFLVTYHPVTLSHVSAVEEVQECLAALDFYPEAGIIFTQSNADAEGREVYNRLQEYVGLHEDRMKLVPTLGQLRYLSAIRHVDAVIGNSSSGILEVPAFYKPTVNIGVRQKGRIMAKSVICCDSDRFSIAKAIERALSAAFRQEIQHQENPYGDGGAAEKILAVLKEYPLSEDCLIKSFYDVEFNQ